MRNAFLAIFVVGLSQVWALETPQVIETYGDSVTAGFMSHTNVTAPPNLTTLSGLLSDLATFVANGDKKKLEKLHARTLSWAVKLKELWGADTVHNYAVTRARTKDLLTQLKHRRPVDADLSVASIFFMGHNDLCHAKDSEEDFIATFRKEYNEAIEAWDNEHDGATLYLLPIGDLDRLYKKLDNFQWLNQGSYKFSCNDSWDSLFPFCRENAKRKRDGTLSEYLVPRTQKMRAVMADLAVAWSKKETGNHFVFLDDVLSGDYKREYFAVDCYHLSEVGQTVLAQDILRSMKAR